MIISVDVRGGNNTWPQDKLIQLAQFALSYAHAPENCELSISLVDNDEIHQLNKDYRGIDKETDVLSFECDDAFSSEAEEESLVLGDIVIACDVVDQQRAKFGTSFDQEMSLMVVHGCLHVLGYDHLNDEQAEEMEALEKEILEAYGIKGVR